MAGFGDEEKSAAILEPERQGHRLGRGGGLIQHGRIGDVQGSEVADHGLEIQERLEPALGNLGLIGRVGRVPAGVFQHVALNHWRGDGVVIALADEGAENLVLLGNAPEFRKRLVFAPRRRQIQLPPETDGGRHRCIDQPVQRGVAEERQHRAGFSRIRSDMAADKLVGVGERVGGGVF